jgi:hypothetical protein
MGSPHHPAAPAVSPMRSGSMRSRSSFARQEWFGRQTERTNQMATPLKPTHRVSFACIIGKDEDGNDKLGQAREIGAIWPRKNGKGGILRFDHVPIELTRGEGVIFINDVERGK